MKCNQKFHPQFRIKFSPESIPFLGAKKLSRSLLILSRRGLFAPRIKICLFSVSWKEEKFIFLWNSDVSRHDFGKRVRAGAESLKGIKIKCPTFSLTSDCPNDKISMDNETRHKDWKSSTPS